MLSVAKQAVLQVNITMTQKSQFRAENDITVITV